MKKTSKPRTSKRKSAKPLRNVGEIPVKKSTSLLDVLVFGLKIIILPFYAIYLLLFKIPNEGPARIVGFLRFVFFVTISYFATKFSFKHSVENFIDSNSWIPFSANTILAIMGAILLWNIFLSFIEIFGFSTGGYWYDPHEDNSNNSVSGYDAIEEGIDYRDTLLRANHASGKLNELKKTGFITKERLSGLGSSPEVNEAFSLLNSQMRAMHKPDKLKTLESIFGGGN